MTAAARHAAIRAALAALALGSFTGLLTALPTGPHPLLHLGVPWLVVASALALDLVLLGPARPVHPGWLLARLVSTLGVVGAMVGLLPPLVAAGWPWFVAMLAPCVVAMAMDGAAALSPRFYARIVWRRHGP